MTPLEINVLLHVYALVRDYRDTQECEHAQSEAVRQTFEWFSSEGLIEKRCEDYDWKAENPNNRHSQFRVTEKGTAMVEHLCAVQVPICKWMQP